MSKQAEQFTEAMADIANPKRHHMRMFEQNVTDILAGDGLEVDIVVDLSGQLVTINTRDPNTDKRYSLNVTHDFIMQDRYPWAQINDAAETLLQAYRSGGVGDERD